MKMMTLFLIYDAKVAVLIAVFYMFYRLMLARETFHRVNRIVLLSTALASFVLPLCVITIHETVLMGADSDGLGGLLADSELRDISEPRDAVTPLWQSVLPVLFIIGMVVTLGHTLLSILKVIRLIHQSEQHPQADGTIICVTGRAELSPFSWMHYIVLRREEYEAHDAAILAHERGHIRLRHSWDLLLVDTLTALQWFNPAMWMLRTDLRAIHEYEADAAVLSQGINARQYQYLLISKAADIGGYSLANGISHSTLKNRINMMLHTKSSSSHLLKLLFLLPVVGAVLALNAKTVTDVVYAGNSADPLGVMTEGNTATITFKAVFKPDNAPITGVPVAVIDNGTVVQELETVGINGEVTVTAPVGATVRFTSPINGETKDFIVNKESKKIVVRFGERIEQAEEKAFTVRGMVVDAAAKPIVGAVVKVVGSTKGTVTDREGRFSVEASTGDALLFSYVGYESEQVGANQISATQGDFTVRLNKIDPRKVYDVVEEMPQFPGGTSALMTYLATNLRYPKEAEQKGLQGRVITSFVVEPYGSISNAHVVKPISPALDREALRMVNAMPKWIPGRQGGQPMRVKYTIPIVFRIEGDTLPPPSADEEVIEHETVVMGRQ